jgi:Asp-tRNA(Asn)/Glu-tRNA(Gln) amidotransferase A subunit family amidase
MSLRRLFAFRLKSIRLAFVAGIFATAIPACQTARTPPPENPRDYAFITYWPAPKDSKQLRLAVKDLIDVKGVVTTAGSQHVAETSPPAARDAACLQEARRRGVHIVGKVNLSEFALGVSGMNEWFGTPKSPLKRRSKLIPGGSSSGSAVAVATGLADVSIGTDTAGSIRVPAACCGVFGLKTTKGLVSLKGVAPISPHYLDTVGPLAKDIPRLVQGMDLLKPGFAGEYREAAAAEPSPRQITVGRVYVGGTNKAIDDAVDQALAASGFRVVKMGDEFTKRWLSAQSDGRSLAVADGWLSDAKYLNTPGVSFVTKAIIRLGEIEYKLNYADLLKQRLAWQRDLRKVFRQVDFLAVPTLQDVPPKLPFWGRSAVFEARVIASQNTAAVNYAGVPALAVPIPLNDKKVPVTSVQLIGPNLSEARLVNAGQLLTRPPETAVAAKVASAVSSQTN